MNLNKVIKEKAKAQIVDQLRQISYANYLPFIRTLCVKMLVLLCNKANIVENSFINIFLKIQLLRQKLTIVEKEKSHFKVNQIYKKYNLILLNMRQEERERETTHYSMIKKYFPRKV